MKSPAKLRTAIAALWSDDEQARAAAAGHLAGMAIDVVDIRAAQPALIVALADASVVVRRAAAYATSLRADSGADVGMAVPALLAHAEEPDAETRKNIWRALRHGCKRQLAALACALAKVQRAAAADPDPEVRDHATRILALLAAAPAPAS